MGMCSKSCCGLSPGNVSLTAGQECTKHGARARLCPGNLQPNTGKLGARTSARRKGSVSAAGRKSNKHSCRSKTVGGRHWKTGSDWTREDRMEKRQAAGQQEETGTDSEKETKL